MVGTEFLPGPLTEVPETNHSVIVPNLYSDSLSVSFLPRRR